MLLLAVAPRSQERTPPENWDTFAAVRQRFDAWLAGGTEALPADLRGYAGFFHAYVTFVPDDPGPRQWMMTFWLPCLRTIHAVRARCPDLQIDADREIGFVVDLKNRGLFATAEQLLVEVLLPAAAGTARRAQLALELAETQRRSFQFAAAAHSLGLVEEEIGGGRARATVPTQRALQRALLELERGRPDAAATWMDEARRHLDLLPATLHPTEGSHAVLRSNVTFGDLRLDIELARSQLAMSRWRQLQASPWAKALAGARGGPRRLAQLRTRVGLAILADPEASDEAEEFAQSALEAALAAASTTDDERLQARSAVAGLYLDRGEIDRAEALLADSGTATGNALDQHRLNEVGLLLRAALDRPAPATIVSQHTAAAVAEYGRLLDSWNRQPLSEQGVGPLFLARWRRVLVEILRALQAQHPPEQAGDLALELIGATQALGSLAREFGATAPSSLVVRSHLCRGNRGLLIFVPGDTRSFALVVGAEAARLIPVSVGTITLDRRRLQLQEAIESVRVDPTSGLRQVRDHAAALAAILLPPAVRQHIDRWSALAIVGIETIGYLPFEILPYADATLGIRKAISYLPSLPVATWLAERRPATSPAKRPAVWLGVATDAAPPAGYDKELLPLPFGTRERTLFERATAGTSLTVAATADCTAGAFRAVGHSDLLQLLTHGVRDETRLDPQGLLLAQGEVLWSADLERGMPQYLVLTACRAGRGRLRRGDDGRHLLAGAAIVGGARGVVVPWLDIEYRATLAFSAAMHRALWEDGVSLEEALRRARVAVVAESPDCIDPYLLHLVGFGEAPIALAASSAVRPWLLPAIGVLLVAGWVGWMARRRRLRPDGY